MKTLILTLVLSLSVSAQVAAPTLSTNERLMLRVLVSESENITNAETALIKRRKDHEAEVQQFIKDVAEAHPGYSLGANGTLVKLPAPEKK